MKEHYRYFLSKEFKVRCDNNTRYTLRAYAQFLDLDSGTLSQILKGKRKLPKTHWLSCSKKLKLKPSEKQAFFQSLWDEQGIDSKNAHLPEKPALLLSSEDYYEFLTEWEFSAALSLFDIKHCQFSVQSISKYLGVNVKKANEIHGKLFQFGLIKIVGDKIERIDQNFASTEDIMSSALQKAHINELLLSIEKIQRLDVLEREFASITFAGDSKDLKRMKVWIKNKINEFDRLFDSKKADQIFQLGVQLYPLTTKVEK